MYTYLYTWFTYIIMYLNNSTYWRSRFEYYTMHLAPAYIGLKSWARSEPTIAEGLARSSPTSSWWALETFVTWARLGPSRRPSEERGGGSGSIGGEIGPPSPSHVSRTPYGLTGFDSYRGQKMEVEVNCHACSKEALP